MYITDIQETDRTTKNYFQHFFYWMYFSGTLKINVSRILGFEKLNNESFLHHPSHEWMQFKS